MGQKLQDDKIGSLAYSAGIITMAASSSIPSFLSIGGQQYRLTSNLTRTIATDVTLVTNTLYMVYAVVSAGSVVMRISANVNSVGPAGFASWKLVGAFFSNAVTGSIAWGGFVNVDGMPSTQWMGMTPVWSSLSGSFSLGSGTTSGYFRVDGDTAHFKCQLTFGAGTSFSGLTFVINPPGSWQRDASKYANESNHKAFGWIRDSSAGLEVGALDVYDWGPNGLTLRILKDTVTSVQLSSTTPFVWATSDAIWLEFSLPINLLSNTAVKDL